MNNLIDVWCNFCFVLYLRNFFVMIISPVIGTGTEYLWHLLAVRAYGCITLCLGCFSRQLVAWYSYSRKVCGGFRPCGAYQRPCRTHLSVVGSVVHVSLLSDFFICKNPHLVQSRSFPHVTSA